MPSYGRVRLRLVRGQLDLRVARGQVEEVKEARREEVTEEERARRGFRRGDFAVLSAFE